MGFSSLGTAGAWVVPGLRCLFPLSYALGGGRVWGEADSGLEPRGSRRSASLGKQALGSGMRWALRVTSLCGGALGLRVHPLQSGSHSGIPLAVAVTFCLLLDLPRVASPGGRRLSKNVRLIRNRHPGVSFQARPLFTGSVTRGRLLRAPHPGGSEPSQLSCHLTTPSQPSQGRKLILKMQILQKESKTGVRSRQAAALTA